MKDSNTFDRREVGQSIDLRQVLASSGASGYVVLGAGLVR